MRAKRLGSKSSDLWIVTAIALLLTLIWVFALREGSARAMALEYEVFRRGSALLEGTLQDSDAPGSDPLIRGFGVYDADGVPSYRVGTAPAAPDFGALGARQSMLELGQESATLVRVLGATPGRMGMMRSMGRRANPGLAWPSAPLSISARYLWIEYSLGAYRAERTLLFSGAAFATALLLAGAGFMLRLSRRNAALAERAARDRELVQLGEAARTIAHEIKNPLGIIRLQSAIARKRLGGVIDGSLAMIDAETERLADLADRIGVFLRSDEGQLESIELGPFLRDFSRRYAGACRLGEAVEGLACSVRIDRGRLTGILDNLARNALDATAGRDASFELDAQALRARAEIRVIDRGAGVPEGSEERIFEPFYTTKAKGSGIGLAIARKWAERAGGTLRFQRREDGATVFLLVLPTA